MTPPLHILFVCNKPPYPAKEGGSIAMNQLIEGLIHTGNRVKVITAYSDKYPVREKDIPESYKKKTGIEFVHLDLSIKPVEVLQNLFSNKSYHVQRFISDDFERKLVNILKSTPFDIVQIETLFMAPYVPVIRKHSRAKIILRAHNIEHLIWKRIAQSSKRPCKKFVLHHFARTLENYEKTVVSQFDGILPITRHDADFFKQHTRQPVKAIPFGIDPAQYSTGTKYSPENAVFHIGAMNWMPNEEGIRWFLKKVWPLVIHKNPQIKVYLAGRFMPRWLRETQIKNVVITGEVADAREFIRSKTIAIAPLFSGSGIRIKIIESMGLGKAVVATTTGAEGIDYTHGKNMLIANTAETFADALIELYENPEKASEIGKNARELVLSQHHHQKIIRSLETFYQEIL